MSNKSGTKKHKSVDIFKDYAEYYDLIYQDKDYDSEARFVDELIRRHFPVRGKTVVLDLACGTGRHAFELSKMGYRMEGSDISADMIYVAREENKRRGANVIFYNESFQTADQIGHTFDVVTSMFSAIDYLTEYDDLVKAFGNICTLLKDDGVFIFDFWNANAVLDGFSPIRVKRMARGSREVLRISETTIDRITQTARIHFAFTLIENAKIIREFQEDHIVRYFLPREMEDLMRANGFTVVYRCPFMDPCGEIAPLDWNLTYISKKTR